MRPTQSSMNGFTNPANYLRAISLAFVTISLLMLITGCASRPTSSSKWLNKEQKSAPYSSVLIVGVTKNRDRRLSFEQSIADDLNNENITAWASTRFMPEGQPVDEPTIRSIAADQQAAGIIVTRVTNIEITPVEIGGRSTVKAEEHQSGFDHTYRRRSGTLFQYDYEEDVEATYLTTEYTTELHTDVYDAASGEHVYELVTSVDKQESLSEVIRILSDEITRRLIRDKVVKQLDTQ